MSVRPNKVYETNSGRRYVVYDTATNCLNNKIMVIFYRQNTKNRLMTMPLEDWNRMQLRLVGNIIQGGR